MADEDPHGAVYHHYSAGKPPVRRPRAQTIEELQTQIDGFLAKHPIAHDPLATARIDRILREREEKDRQSRLKKSR